MGYPSLKEEVDILNRQSLTSPIDQLEKVASGEEILKLQDIVKHIHMDQCLTQYIVNITAATRSHASIMLGASVRGSLSLYRATQARALCRGRQYAIPDDIKAMILPVLSHRIILTQEAKLRSVTEEQVVNEIMQTVPVPVMKS